MGEGVPLITPTILCFFPCTLPHQDREASSQPGTTLV